MYLYDRRPIEHIRAEESAKIDIGMAVWSVVVIFTAVVISVV